MQKIYGSKRAEMVWKQGAQNKMHKKTLLYFYVGKSTFIEKDLSIFRESYLVHDFNFHTDAKWKNVFLFFKQFIFLLRHIFSSKLLVSQFSGYHSFLPGVFAKLTGRPFLIISGGTDCHRFPSIGYGNFYKALLGIFTRWSYSLCTHIAPKHLSLWECDYTYDQYDGNKQGIHSFMPRLKKDITVIENGYDASLYHKTKPKSARSILSIAGNLNYPFQMELKGIDLVLKVAEFFPDYTFTIVNSGDPVAFKNTPTNVVFKSNMTTSLLIDLYSTHTFYFQLSIAEGFPNSLCEAMLCECVPIGSSVFSIPEIIGDSGFILPHRDLSLLKDIFTKALACNTQKLGRRARQRIAETYTLDKRRTELLQLCNSLCEKKK